MAHRVLAFRSRPKLGWYELVLVQSLRQELQLVCSCRGQLLIGVCRGQVLKRIMSLALQL